MKKNKHTILQKAIALSTTRIMCTWCKPVRTSLQMTKPEREKTGNNNICHLQSYFYLRRVEESYLVGESDFSRLGEK